MRCPSSVLVMSQCLVSGWPCRYWSWRGPARSGTKPSMRYSTPLAIRLLEKCDGVLRIGGPSVGADEMVRIGRSLGLKIYAALAEIPRSE